jgi:aerobic carbon-monoxide dehydrogenase large subunit
VYSATQIPHILRVMVAATCGEPEHKVRVVAPSVGGGFGSKLNVYAEELIGVALARKLGAPTRWNEGRTENAVATIQGRGQVQQMELAADADGKVTAVRANLTADMGAYLQLVTPGIPLLGAFLYHGVYDVPAYHFECTGVFTNRTPTDAYRGAGRPEATYAVERAMDALAREVGVDGAEIRRRNYIPPDKFPYESSGGLTYDSGNYEPTLDRALELVGYDDLRAEQQRRRDAGDTMHLGIGITTYVEMCGLAPSRVLASLNYAAGGWDAATVRVLPTGKVQVVTGTSPHGQGHETCWSQIVADRLHVDPADIEVLHSDTAIAPHGMDTYGSRSLPVGGVAVAMATDQVIAKARRIAAHQLECSEDDLELLEGELRVRGTPSKAMTLQAVAFEAFSAHDLPGEIEPILAAEVFYDPPNFVFPFGTHVAVVEVDEETGQVKLLDYAAVDDCGPQVNPMIVEGQLHGGIVQGVAQALWEEAVYDDEGNLRNPTLIDYCVPSAAEVPSFRLDHTVTPSPTNVLGVKGIGEAGTIGSTPTVVNAIVDALAPFGITDMAMPAHPERVWAAIREARS